MPLVERPRSREHGIRPQLLLECVPLPAVVSDGPRIVPQRRAVQTFMAPPQRLRIVAGARGGSPTAAAPESSHTGLNADVHGAAVPVSHTVTAPSVTWATIDPVVWLMRMGP